MSGDTRQLSFPFYSLDFPERWTLKVGEVAERLGVSEQHILNLIDEGEFGSLNLAPGRTRKLVRIPVEAYRDFVLRAYSGDLRAKFLRALPRAALVAIHHDILQILNDKSWLDQ